MKDYVAKIDGGEGGETVIRAGSAAKALAQAIACASWIQPTGSTTSSLQELQMEHCEMDKKKRREKMKNTTLLGNFQSVSQFNGHNGAVKNQFIIQTDKGLVFQSYNTIIAAKISGKRYLDKNSWDYSVTTGKYRNQFLGETKKETEAKIKSGEYILTDLNGGE